MNKSQGQTNKDMTNVKAKNPLAQAKQKHSIANTSKFTLSQQCDVIIMQLTVEDMKHHIRPCLARKPREIILHVGTNDLAKKSSREYELYIADIVNIIHVESPANKLKHMLSEIMVRTNSSSYKPKIGKINHQFQCYTG